MFKSVCCSKRLYCINVNQDFYVNLSIVSSSSYLVFCVQRTGTRRRYHDDGISDDEIEGKRSFDLEEKLQSDRYNSDLVKIMDGKGVC